MKTYAMNPAESEFSGQKLHFIDIEQEPFEIKGFGWYDKERKFCRLPEHVLADNSINEAARSLAWETSGGLLRFKTDSSWLVIKAEYICKTFSNNLSVSGASAFDVYLGRGARKKFHYAAIPSLNFKKGRFGYEKKFAFEYPVTEVEFKLENFLYSGLDAAETLEVTINFPTYDGVKDIRLGVIPGAEILPPTPFKYSKPIAFYGSSITQGGCASHPGNTYANVLGRRIDAPVLNFGFSGSGRGEPALAHAIAGLELSAFILDYDANAPTVEHLEETHGRFFQIVREGQPSLPVLIMTGCHYDQNPKASDERATVIKRTYDNAVAAGDKNVHFIHGKTLFGKKDRDACTVDTVHPNDLGFIRMADRICPILKKAIEHRQYL